MAFGNKLGVKLEDGLSAVEIFKPYYGDIVAEVAAEDMDKLTAEYTVCGTVTEAPEFVYKDMKVTMGEAIDAWTNRWNRYFRQNPVWKKRKSIPIYMSRRISISANIKWQDRRYLSRYSRVQTVNMIQ